MAITNSINNKTDSLQVTESIDTTQSSIVEFRAWDVDDATYRTFITLSADATVPTMDLDDSVTKASQYIYRVGGDDISVEDGGTGTSTLTNHGILLGSGTSAITALGVATDGQIPIGSAGADPVLGNITATDGTLTITNGAGTIDAKAAAGIATLTGFASWSGGAPYFDDTTIGSFTVSQAGTGYIEGVPVSWAGGQTVTGMTAGNTYYIYMDNTGTIGKTTTYNEALFRSNITLFECLRDSTTGTNIQVTVKENHPYQFPWATSLWAHDTLGSVIADSGGANITLNGTQKIEISGADALEDHGLETNIPDSGGVAEVFEQYYTLGSGKWARNAQSDTFDGTWDNAGTPTAISGNKYTVNRLYVSKDNINSATPVYFSVMGDAEYNNLSAADTAIANDSIPTATGELAMLELAQLGYIVFEESSTSIVQVVIAKETARTSFSGVTSTSAALVLTDVTNFDWILSAADTTVQSALETIDEWGKTPESQGLITAGAGLTATTGDVSVTAGNLNLPATNAALTEGVIEINGVRYFHAYGAGDNLFIGANSGNGSLSAAAVGNIGIGTNTLQTMSGVAFDDYNVAIGPDALKNLVGGRQNIALGFSSMITATTAEFNTAIGLSSLYALTSGLANTVVGNNGLQNITTGSYNISLGQSAASALTTSDSDNIILSNTGTVGDNNTIRIGTQGTGDKQQDKCFIAGINGVTPVGAVAGTVLVDANGQLGTVGDVISTANLNLPTTNAALTEGVIEFNSVRQFHTYGTNNLFIGDGAGNGTTTGTGKNVGIGAASLDALTTGSNNMAIGSDALTACTDGAGNVAIGADVLESVTDGDYNIGIGFVAAPFLTTGVRNCCIGVGALGGAGVTSASYNTCIGNNGGGSLTTSDSDNVCIMSAGVAGDNNTIRLGTQGTGDGQQDTTFVAGIVGTNVGSVATVVAHDANGKLGTSTITAGANITVTPGASTITIASTASGGGLTWEIKTADLDPMVVDTGYIANKAGLLTFTLPTTCAVGKVLRVTGMNTDAGWKIEQSAGQQIHFGAVSTTAGTGGSLASSLKRDSVELVCVVADDEFNVTSSVGNITIV